MDVPRVFRDAAEEYKAILREMECRGIKHEDVPEYVAQALSILQENMLMVQRIDDLNRKVNQVLLEQIKGIRRA